jgi:hypothetical protein
MLREVAAASESDRGTIIGGYLDRWTDDAAAAERFAALKKQVAALRVSACLLFVLVFLFGPMMYYLPWRPSALGVAGYFAMLLSTWMLTVWDYGACRKQLFGEKFSARFRHVGILLLSPASAMRSPEVLLRRGLAAFHPLAAAAALCARPRFAELARPLLLALDHPLPSEVPSDPGACRTDAWFRKKVRKRLHSLVRRVEIDAVELLRPAPPLGDSRSYCPRCQNQFVLAEGVCPDCGGLALVAYPGDGQTAEG